MKRHSAFALFAWFAAGTMAHADPFSDAAECYDFVENGFFEQAIMTCSSALESGVLSEANEAVTLNNRGRAWLRLEDVDRARTDFTNAIRLDANNAQALNNIAIVRHLQGDLAGAERALDQAVDLAPSYANAFYNRGVVRRDLAKTAAALEDFVAALQIDADFDAASVQRDALIERLRSPSDAVAAAEERPSPKKTSDVTQSELAAERADRANAIVASAPRVDDDIVQDRAENSVQDSVAEFVADASVSNVVDFDLSAADALAAYASFAMKEDDGDEAFSASAAPAPGAIEPVELASAADLTVASTAPGRPSAPTPPTDAGVQTAQADDPQGPVRYMMARFTPITADLLAPETEEAQAENATATDKAALVQETYGETITLEAYRQAIRDGAFDVREVQERLAVLGYDPGPVDGMFGPKTNAAIEQCFADGCEIVAR